MLLLLHADAFADGASLTTTFEREDRHGAYARLNYHSEHRDEEHHSNFDVVAGYDFAIVHNFFVGPRIGLYQENLLTVSEHTHTKPFVGAQAYVLIGPTERVNIRLGIAADLLEGDEMDPLHLYVAAEPALRFQGSEDFYVEVPFSIGALPHFTPTVTVFKTGVQAGVTF